MIRSTLALAADTVLRDADTNAITVVSLFEGILPVGLPVFLQRLVFAVFWEREATDPARVEGRFTATIGGDALITQQLFVDFAEHLRSRSFVRLNGLLIPRPGTLALRIALDGGIASEYSFPIQTPVVANDPPNQQPRDIRR